MGFRHVLLGFGVLSMAGWYTIGHYAMKTNTRMPEPEINQHMKAGLEQINASDKRDINDWLHVSKTELGWKWFGLVTTVSRQGMPPECADPQFGVASTCLNLAVLRKYYCQFDEFRKLPTADLFNEITVTYELHFDDEPQSGAIHGEFRFKSCKGLKT